MAATILFLWGTYILVHVIEAWTRRSSGAAPPHWGWLVTLTTICYSATFVAVVHVSVERTLAFAVGMSAGRKRGWRWAAGVWLGGVFAVRLARTGIFFARTAAFGGSVAGDDKEWDVNPAMVRLGYVAAAIQALTVIPSFLLRLTLDAISIRKLFETRYRCIEATGMEAFRMIVASLVVEAVLTVITLLVAIQEAMNYKGPKFAYVDWILISWSIASWIDQKQLYRQILSTQTPHPITYGPSSHFHVAHVMPGGGVTSYGSGCGYHLPLGQAVGGGGHFAGPLGAADPASGLFSVADVRTGNAGGLGVVPEGNGGRWDERSTGSGSSGGSTVVGGGGVLHAAGAVLPRTPRPRSHTSTSHRYHRYQQSRMLQQQVSAASNGSKQRPPILAQTFADLDIDKKPPVVSVSPSTTIEDALSVMAKHNILTLPITSRVWPDKYVYVLSSLDILQFFVSRHRGKLAGLDLTSTVDAAMTLDAEQESYRVYERDFRDTLEATLIAFAKGTHRALISDALRTRPTVLLTQTDVLRHMAGDPARYAGAPTEFTSSLGALGFTSRGAVLVVAESEAAIDGYARMAAKKVPALPVVDEKGVVVDTLSASDLRGMSAATLTNVQLPVREFVKLSPTHRNSTVSLAETDTLATALKTLVDANVHRAWILDAQGKPIGVVSQSDIIGAVVGLRPEQIHA
ncbi:hypothetical protein HDU96_004911 [Phlyctochytrium bullatum]|nr:hypothetical protein HDU96_004911 [Phlyctochytrium bullatum]